MTTADNDEDKILADWSRRLVDALQILEFKVDTQEILGLAGRAAHSVVRPAAPLTTFIVGYAAGLAAAGGKSPEAAVTDATAVALELCRTNSVADPPATEPRGAGSDSAGARTADPSAEGWTNTGQ